MLEVDNIIELNNSMLLSSATQSVFVPIQNLASGIIWSAKGSDGGRRSITCLMIANDTDDFRRIQCRPIPTDTRWAVDHGAGSVGGGDAGAASGTYGVAR